MEIHDNLEPELIVRFLSGDASVEEEFEIERWADARKENRQHLNEMISLWELTESVGDISSIQVAKDWEKVKGEINTIRKTEVIRSRPQQTSPTFHFVRIAAVLAIIITCFLYIFISPLFTKPIIIATSTSKSEITLPDGTKVFLNKNTSLTYPKEFGKQKREVVLHGEAFFEVSKDPSKPFLIRAENSITEVLGTSFNVNTIDSGKVVVTVSTGKVVFYAASDLQKKIVLMPDEQGTLDRGKGLFKGINEDTNFLAWKTGMLSFRNTILPQVIHDLNRYYETNILLKGSFKHCTLTSTFQGQSLDDVLMELQLVLSIQIERENTGIVITGTGCTQ